MMTDFPEFKDIDMADSAELCGYGHLLFSVFGKAGGLMAPQRRDVVTLERVLSNAALWTGWVYGNIGRSDTFRMPALLTMYEVIYAIAYGSSPGRGFVCRWTDSYSSAWLTCGDPRLGYEVMNRYCCQPGIFLPKVGRRCHTVLKGWAGADIGGESVGDIHRLTCLSHALANGLVTCDRRPVVAAAARCVERLDSPSGLDCATLLALGDLLAALIPSGCVGQERSRHYRRSLGCALSQSEGLNRWDRLAYAIDSELY